MESAAKKSMHPLSLSDLPFTIGYLTPSRARFQLRLAALCYRLNCMVVESSCA